MTLVMERTGAQGAATTPRGAFELIVTIGETPTLSFLLDPSDGATGAEHFQRVRKRLPGYFDWLRVPSEPALSFVDELLPRHPETLPTLPFGLLVAPRWADGRESVEVYVNTTYRRHNELLVRVPAWAKRLLGNQPIERWVALQPHLSRLGKVGLIGVETSSTGSRALEVFLKVDDLQTEDLKILAMLAGAPSGELIHLWRSLSISAGSDACPTLLSVRLAGKESLDLGVSFAARRAGSSSEIQKRISWLARVHGLDACRYLQSIEEVQGLTGRAPEHTTLGFSSENGRVLVTASFESVTAQQRLSRAS